MKLRKKTFNVICTCICDFKNRTLYQYSNITVLSNCAMQIFTNKTENRYLLLTYRCMYYFYLSSINNVTCLSFKFFFTTNPFHQNCTQQSQAYIQFMVPEGQTKQFFILAVESQKLTFGICHLSFFSCNSFPIVKFCQKWFWGRVSSHESSKHSLRINSGSHCQVGVLETMPEKKYTVY